MNITEFLLARISEDEAYAAQAQGEHYGWIDYWRVTDTRQGTRTESIIYAHAFRFDPERVLAECAAKRAIIEEHSPVDYSRIGMKSPNACNICGVENTMSDWEWDENSFPCKTLRAIAAIYADHPDYQQEWAL